MEDYSRSDLACESGGIKDGAGLPEGMYREETVGAYTVSRLLIRDKAYEEMLGKPRGTYVTVMCGKIWLMGGEEFSSLSSLVAREIRAMCAKVCGKSVDRGFGKGVFS